VDTGRQEPVAGTVLARTLIVYALFLLQLAAALAATAILTRRLSVLDFGSLNYLLAICDVGMVLLGFGLHNYIIREVAQNANVGLILRSTWTFVAANCLLVVPLVFLGARSDPIIRRLGWGVLVPLVVAQLVTLGGAWLLNVLTGRQHVVRATALGILQTVFYIGLLLVIEATRGALDPTGVAWAMCVAAVLGTGVTVAANWSFVTEAVAARPLPIGTRYVQLLHFGWPFFLASAAGVVITRASFPIIRFLGNPGDLGDLGLVDRVVLPLNLGVTALIQVAYPILSRQMLEARDRAVDFVLRATRISVAIAAWVCAGAVLFAVPAVDLVFGSMYRGTALPLAIGTGKFIVYPVLCLMGALMNAAGLERRLQALSWLGVLVNVGLFLLLGPPFGVAGIASGFVVADAITLGLVLWALAGLIPAGAVLSTYARTLAAAVLLVVPACLVPLMAARATVFVVLSVVYVWVLLRMGVIARSDLQAVRRLGRVILKRWE